MGKHILVLGAGKIGQAIAWDLGRRDEIEKVTLVDLQRQALDEAEARIGSLDEERGEATAAKLDTATADVGDAPRMQQLMAGCDAGIIALDKRRISYKAIETAIAARLDVVDILEEYHRYPDTEEDEGLERPKGMKHSQYGEDLHRRAEASGVTVLDGMGFAPGLSNVTLGRGVRLLEEAGIPRQEISAVARVGGIPLRRSAKGGALQYMVTWAFHHVLREYMIKAEVVEKGRTRKADPMAELRDLKFDAFGINEDLECFVTPGMPSFPLTRKGLWEFKEKTIRWPGHWQAIQLLRACGLLEQKKHPFKDAHVDAAVSPREVLSSILQPILAPTPDDRDVCVMVNTVKGPVGKARVDYYLWSEADREFTAMQRVTGFTAAAAAVMLAHDRIPRKGIVAPEDGIVGALYEDLLRDLRERQIVVGERLQDVRPLAS